MSCCVVDRWVRAEGRRCEVDALPAREQGWGSMGWGIPACVGVCDGRALAEDVAQLACGCEGAARFALVDLSGGGGAGGEGQV